MVVRLLALNDSFEPVALDRRLLVGPNPVHDGMVGVPLPVSVEPVFARQEQNEVILNPLSLCGRERTFDRLPPGHLTLHGYLLERSVDVLLPQGPEDSEALMVAAEPLVVRIS